MTTRILLLNDPNLNLLGLRDPHLYGSTPLPVVEKRLIEFATGLGVELTAAQRNSEGELVTLLQDAVDSYDGAIINPGPLSHYGLSLRDVIDVIPVPVIEVHLTNIHAREEFRRHSIISAVARGTICGLRVDGYELAIRELLTLVSRESDHGCSQDCRRRPVRVPRCGAPGSALRGRTDRSVPLCHR